jgi:hypothetical protein
MPSTNPSQRGCRGGAAIFSSRHTSLAAPSLSCCAAPLLLCLPYLVTPPSLVAPPPLSLRHASFTAPFLSCCATPLSPRRPSLVAPPISHRTTASLIAPCLARAGWLLHHRLSCHATAFHIAQPLSCRAAPLSSSHQAAYLLLHLSGTGWLLHHCLSFSRCAAFVIVRRVHRPRCRRPLPPTTFVFLESTQWLSAIGRMGAGGGGFDGTTRGAALAKKHGSCENAVWTGLNLVQNLDSMFGHAVQIF